MLRPLEALLHAIERIDARPQFVFAGDYINRGPDSRGVVELLLSLRNGRFARGNHDDVFDQILNNASLLLPDTAPDPSGMYRQFCDHGLVQTLESYGLSTAEIARPFQTNRPESVRAIAERIPMSHRDFFRRLPGFIEDHDFFLVHGRWPTNQTWTPAMAPRQPLALSVRREMLWGRFSEAELAATPRWDKPGFFGHTPVQTYPGHEHSAAPIRSDKLTLLDTAVALAVGGRLTAACVESTQILQVDRESQVVA